MKRVLILGVLAAVTVSAGSARAGGTACPISNPPNELVLVGGSGQQAQLGRQFAQNLQVQLANTNGCPLTGNLAGVTVNFDAPGSGASGTFAGSGSREAYVGTDVQGMAVAPPFTANDTAGAYTVDAHSDYGTVELSLSNTSAGIPASISAVGATSAETIVNESYAQPLVVRVSDANGNPVQGANVTFAVAPGLTGAGASFLGGAPSATTDSTGLAVAPQLVANGLPGRFVVTASVAGLGAVATYSLDNHAGVTTLKATFTRDPKTAVGTRYRSLLQARLLDSDGQPLEGATVTFAISPADNGAGATFLGGTGQAVVVTDANGLATAPPLVANKTAGTFSATATATGAHPSLYVLENVAAAPAGIAAGVANGQSTTIGTRFPIPLAVTVTDKNGNAVTGAVVTFTAPASGARGLFGARRRVVHVKTNGKGIAVAPPLVANRSTGGYVVIAAVGAVRTAFSLSNLPRG